MKDTEVIKDGFRMMPLTQIEINIGQLEGLPQNPRQIGDDDYIKLKENISNYAEMLTWRSMLVYPLDNGNYVIIGGNMRYKAMLELGYTEAPVFIIPKSTSIERLKAYTILDNSGFGRWDWTKLTSEEWDSAQLTEWGVDMPMMASEIDIDSFFEEHSGENSQPKDEHIVIIIPADRLDEKEEIKSVVKDALIDTQWSGLKIK